MSISIPVIFTIYGENKGRAAGLFDGETFMGDNECSRGLNSLQSMSKDKKIIFVWMSSIESFVTF